MFPAVGRQGSRQAAVFLLLEKAVLQLAGGLLVPPCLVEPVQALLGFRRDVFARDDGFRIFVGRAVHVLIDGPVGQGDGHGQDVVLFGKVRLGNLPFFFPGANAVLADKFDVADLLGDIVVLIINLVFRLEFLAAAGTDQR